MTVAPATQIIIPGGEERYIALDEEGDHSLEIILMGEGARVEVRGRFHGFADDTQNAMIRIVHRAPRTESKVDIRAALRDSSASFFDALIRIEESAKGSRGFLSYKALLLSNSAKAKPIPRLEVLTKDVVSVGHAASVGKIDAQQLFYLQSRGLSREDAERLIIKGFLKE